MLLNLVVLVRTASLLKQLHEGKERYNGLILIAELECTK